MEFSKIFGKAFRYPLNLKLFFILFVFSFCITIPTMIYMPTQGLETFSVSEIKAFFGFLVPLWLVSFFVGNFLAAFYFDSASRYSSKMKYGKLKDSFETTKKRYLPLLATQILFFIILGIVFLVFGGFSMLSFYMVLPSIFLVGIFIGVLAIVVVAFFLFFCPVACVLDKLGPVDSLKTSFKFVKVNKINTFVFCLILFIVVFFIGLLGSFPSTLYYITTGSVTYGLTAENLLFTIINIIFGAYTGLFAYSAQVNYYHYLKKETKFISKMTVKKKKIN
ncbi:MAG: hypothetical protein KAT37_04535 [Candidatus Aenigmarchaeota archaeon]|nr:hypothetical protein [Candidatus Aenigmarchaeota archaeon]